MIDDNMRPHARSVFANPPSFLFEASCSGSGSKGMSRQSLCAIFLRVEPGEMLAEDFGARIALEALRARVPCLDVALCVQHVYRVIGYSLDEHLKALLIRLTC
jgi:hypothetical protein